VKSQTHDFASDGVCLDVPVFSGVCGFPLLAETSPSKPAPATVSATMQPSKKAVEMLKAK
jgi:hypothetical protein